MSLSETDVLGFEDEGEDPISMDPLDPQEAHLLAKEARPARKRQARQLTEEDLPVNDYVSLAVKFKARFQPCYISKGRRKRSLCVSSLLPAIQPLLVVSLSNSKSLWKVFLRSLF